MTLLEEAKMRAENAAECMEATNFDDGWVRELQFCEKVVELLEKLGCEPGEIVVKPAIESMPVVGNTCSLCGAAIASPPTGTRIAVLKEGGEESKA